MRGALEGTRRWLDENFFRDAPPVSRAGPSRWIIATVAGVALVGVQLLRMRSSAPLNSLWAEDGYAWLSDALHHSFFYALTTPDDGYLQTLSRLVAEPVS